MHVLGTSTRNQPAIRRFVAVKSTADCDQTIAPEYDKMSCWLRWIGCPPCAPLAALSHTSHAEMLAKPPESGSTAEAARLFAICHACFHVKVICSVIIVQWLQCTVACILAVYEHVSSWPICEC